MLKTRLSRLEVMLICAIFALLTVYGYFFLVIPQSWSLRDDYSWVRQWGAAGFDHWRGAREYLHNIMVTGRFNPVDVLARIVHFRYLPATPRAFHVSLLFRALFQVGALAWFLRQLRLDRERILLAVLLALSSFSLKEGLVSLVVSESWANAFLFLSLGLLASQKQSTRWWAPPAFALSFLSKESYCVLYVALLALEFTPVLIGARKLSIARALPTAVAGAFVVIFGLFIRSLPKIYTGGLSASKIAFLPVMKSLILPPVKNFGPGFALLVIGLALNSRRNRGRFRFEPVEWSLLAVGAAIVLVFSVFLNAWGPFDSWYYLHTPIPFGWALLFAAICGSPEAAKTKERKIHGTLAGIVCFYALVVTLNGSRNYTSYLATAKTMAEMACEDSARVPRLKIFSNCNEGSSQLREYLLLSRVCPNPPEFKYLNLANRLPGDVRPPYEVVLSSKCDGFDESSFHASHRITIDAWTLLKNF